MEEYKKFTSKETIFYFLDTSESFYTFLIFVT